MLHLAGRVCVFAMLLVAGGSGGCDCGSSLSKVGALADRYTIGSEPFLLDPGSLESVPAAGEIDLDFGPVDVDQVSRQYLFVRNDGEVALVLSGIERDPAWPSAFFVACPAGGQFVDDCPGLDETGLSVAPGAELVLEFRFAPSTEGPAGTWCGLSLNADDHPLLTVRLSGQGVARSVDLCAADCIGGEMDPACQAAAQVCGPPLSVAFGQLGPGETRSRSVRVVNRGGRAAAAELPASKLWPGRSGPGPGGPGAGHQP